jgi:DNA-damage-inducible protein D
MSDTRMTPALFQQATIRRVWYHEEWFYSLNDVIAILTESKNPPAYWAKLKERLTNEGAQETLVAIVQLRLPAADKRFRLTDTANRATLLRIIQSVPSPRAEPFRQWLAEVGDERFAEIEHPEAAIERVRQAYRDRGHDEAWIEARIRNDLTRNELTDEWQARGAQEGREYAILTNEISQGTFDIAIQQHKLVKLLPARANLRDHMTTLELALISLGEATATVLHRNRDSQGFDKLHRDAHDAGSAAGRARREIEAATGESAVSPENHLALAKTSTGAKRKKGAAKPTAEEQPPARANEGDVDQLSLFDQPTNDTD